MLHGVLLVHMFIFVVPEVYMWPLGEKAQHVNIEEEYRHTTESVAPHDIILTLRMVAMSNQFHSRFCLWLRM